MCNVESLEIDVNGVITTDHTVAHGFMVFAGPLAHDVVGDWYRTSPEDIEEAEAEASKIETKLHDEEDKVFEAVAILDKADDVDDDQMYDLIQSALGVLNG